MRSLEPGWHQKRMDNFNVLTSGGVQEQDLVQDGWTEIIRNLLFMVSNEEDPDRSHEALARKMELADFTANYSHALNEQSKHIGYVVKACLEGNQKIVEATEAAENEWVSTTVDLARLNEKFLADCTPGYYNNEGKPEEPLLQNANYGLGPAVFYQLLEDWRADGRMQGLQIT